jgi:hypothetical protein
VFNFQKLKKLTKIGLTAMITVSTIGIQPGSTASFKFTDFTFKRASSNLTKFHNTTYPNGKKGVQAFTQFVQGESIAVKMEDLNARKLDPSKLKLIQDYAVKIYFIDEGAGYQNQLYLDTIDADGKDGMIFYNGSVGTSNSTLRKGDYVELGTIPHGASLDFWLRANGYNTSKPNNTDPSANVWYADIAKNVDGIQHVMAFEYQGYLVLAFEDLYGGGDKDYNDIVFAIDIGATNLAGIPSSPDTNLAPIANDDTKTTPYNTEVTIDVLSNDTDPENQALTLTKLDSISSESSGTSITTSNGSVAISNNKVVYTPNEEFSGIDSFTYTVKDSQNVTDTATVTVTIDPASCNSNNGHGNNAPVTYDLGGGVKIKISQYDPSNPSGQQTNSLKAALAQGKTGKVANGANTSSVTLVSGSSYILTEEEANDLVDNYPDWEMNGDGSIKDCSDSGITPGSEIPFGDPPADPPEDPTNPTDPNDPPEDPTDPPEDPTDPPEDPTDPPEDPADPPTELEPPTDPKNPNKPDWKCQNGICTDKQGNEVYVD